MLERSPNLASHVALLTRRLPLSVVVEAMTR
jgi:hypothetical protein